MIQYNDYIYDNDLTGKVWWTVPQLVGNVEYGTTAVGICERGVLYIARNDKTFLGEKKYVLDVCEYGDVNELHYDSYRSLAGFLIGCGMVLVSLVMTLLVVTEGTVTFDVQGVARLVKFGIFYGVLLSIGLVLIVKTRRVRFTWELDNGDILRCIAPPVSDASDEDVNALFSLAKANGIKTVFHNQDEFEYRYG